MDWETFEASVRQDFAGQKLAVKKLRQVHQLAVNSIGVQPGYALQHLIRHHIVTWSYQQQQMAELELELVNSLHQLPAAPYLLSLGLGEVTTALIAAELGDLSRFSAAKQLVKLAGIQPTANQSGEYERQKTPMSHKGRARLRTYLFFATMRLIRWDASFKQKHQALINRPSRPLKRLESVGALMNKLILLIWAVSRDQMMYSPQRFLAN
jgi:transposase